MYLSHSIRYWIILLLLEVAAGVNAALVFRYLERGMAGYLAGSFFFAVGVMAICIAYKKSVRLKWLNVVVAGVYLFVFSAPLFVARILTPYSEPVTDVFGFPLGIVHNYSVTSFKFLFAITVIQIVYIFWLNKSLIFGSKSKS